MCNYGHPDEEEGEIFLSLDDFLRHLDDLDILPEDDDQ